MRLAARPGDRSLPERGSVSPIPFVSMGASGAALVFLHANGYPPECYLTLLSELAAVHRVLAMHQRPLWAGSRPEDVDSWHPLSDDLLRFLDERGAEKVIAVGHSMGAIVALRAAMLSPGPFEALVLLDPVLAQRRTMVAWRLFRKLGMGHHLHAKIASASRRRRSFGSQEEAFRGYRQREVFRHMPDDALRLLVAGLTAPDSNGGSRLRYSPEWESRLYHAAIWNDGDLWNGLPALTVPTLIVRGAESDTLTESTCRAARRANARIQIASVDRASHLVPLEQPSTVHQIIQDFTHGLPAAPSRDVKTSTGKGMTSTRHQD